MNPQDLPKPFAQASQKLLAHAHKSEAEPPQKERLRRFEGWLRLWLPDHLSLSVVFTRNKRIWLSYRVQRQHVQLRLHELFATQGAEVAQRIATTIAAQGRVLSREKTYLQSCVAQLQKRCFAAMPHPVLPRLVHAGAVHNLQALFERVNAGQFGGRCRAQITWGRRSACSRRRRSITLGSFCSTTNLIRIHPCLDQDFVPEFVVCGVIHHEMLHEALGVRTRHGRRRVHPPEFVAIERMYADYDRCHAWERANLHRLLRYCP